MTDFITENQTFWLAQLLGLIGAVFLYLRMGKSDRRDFNLYHTYLCIPMCLHFLLLGAWTMASLCAVGALRTYLLTTEWGWNKRSIVVLACLAVPIGGSVYTATHLMDWILLASTVWAVGSEALKSFFNLRVATLFNTLCWGMNSLTFGAYINAVAQFAALVNNTRSMERDFMAVTRVRAFMGCKKSRLACLAQAA